MKSNELLLIVDVQNGFISDRTNHIVPLLEKLLKSKRFKQIVFSQFENSDSSPYELFLDWYRLKSSNETEIVNSLKPFVEQVIHKNTYTAVNDWLIDLIKKENIETVYIAGIDTDCCVLTTAVDIFQLGVRPVVISDFCASNGGIESHNAALLVLKRLIGGKQIISQV